MHFPPFASSLTDPTGNGIASAEVIATKCLHFKCCGCRWQRRLLQTTNNIDHSASNRYQLLSFELSCWEIVIACMLSARKTNTNLTAHHYNEHNNVNNDSKLEHNGRHWKICLFQAQPTGLSITNRTIACLTSIVCLSRVQFSCKSSIPLHNNRLGCSNWIHNWCIFRTSDYKRNMTNILKSFCLPLTTFSIWLCWC